MENKRLIKKLEDDRNKFNSEISELKTLRDCDNTLGADLRAQIVDFKQLFDKLKQENAISNAGKFEKTEIETQTEDQITKISLNYTKHQLIEKIQGQEMFIKQLSIEPNLSDENLKVENSDLSSKIKRYKLKNASQKAVIRCYVERCDLDSQSSLEILKKNNVHQTEKIKELQNEILVAETKLAVQLRDFTNLSKLSDKRIVDTEKDAEKLKCLLTNQKVTSENLMKNVTKLRRGGQPC